MDSNPAVAYKVKESGFKAKDSQASIAFGFELVFKVNQNKRIWKYNRQLCKDWPLAEQHEELLECLPSCVERTFSKPRRHEHRSDLPKPDEESAVFHGLSLAKEREVCTGITKLCWEAWLSRYQYMSIPEQEWDRNGWLGCVNFLFERTRVVEEKSETTSHLGYINPLIQTERIRKHQKAACRKLDHFHNIAACGCRQLLKSLYVFVTFTTSLHMPLLNATSELANFRLSEPKNDKWFLKNDSVHLLIWAITIETLSSVAHWLRWHLRDMCFLMSQNFGPFLPRCERSSPLHVAKIHPELWLPSHRWYRGIGSTLRSQTYRGVSHFILKQKKWIHAQSNMKQ